MFDCKSLGLLTFIHVPADDFNPYADCLVRPWFKRLKAALITTCGAADVGI